MTDPSKQPKIPREPVQPAPFKHHGALRRLEQNWLTWLLLMASPYITAPFGEHHVAFWDWVWSIEPKKRPRPWVSIWPRGGGKSVAAELATIALGARGIRRYVLYVSGTQDLADRHLESIGERLESEEMAMWYPAMAAKSVGKFGQTKGWRRNRLHTKSGFVVDALGLDAAARGIRVDVQRPDCLVFDDLDDSYETPELVARKIDSLTRRILPAVTHDAAILGIQNMIHQESVFAQLSDGRAEFLADRILSGPIPALADFRYETQTNEEGAPRIVITGGTPTWAGLDLAACQDEIDKEGITVFLSELQHEVPESTGGMFDHVTFRRCTPAEVPHLDKVACWVDPAVTDRKESDSCGIQIDGIARDGTLYRLWSWEERSSPQKAIELAFRMALTHGASYIGIEIDHGHETWRSVFTEARNRMGDDYKHIHMRSVKAAAGFGSKVSRSSQMLSDYERGAIVHVEGTHHVLERALIRFPRTPPLDLADASFYGWWDLRRLSRPATISSAVGYGTVRRGRYGTVRRGQIPSVAVPSGATDPRGRLRLVSMRHTPKDA